MPSTGVLAVFVVATLGLIAVPGPSTFFILGRGISAGRRVAMISALGVETGTVLYVCLTAFGLSALIASTTYAFTAVHYVGAVYLFFLAWRALRHRVQTSRLDDQPARSGWASYRQGFVVGASNPKVALFFIAFFPQFVRPERGSATAQTLVLGTIFVTLGLLADFTNAAGSSAIGSWLSRRPALLRVRGRIEGVTYAGLGTWSLLGGSGSRASS